MIKNIFKKIMFSGFLLYCFNRLTVNYNVIIPINFYNLSIISFLGIPGFIGLILFRFIIW